MTNNSQVWAVRLGTPGNDEWAADVAFVSLSDERWASVKEQAEKYAKFNSRTCPPVSASDSNRRLRFRLGHAMEKPQVVDRLSSVECETLCNNLVGCCEGLYKNGLGLRYLDRELVWKVDGFFAFVPVFWLPALPDGQVSNGRGWHHHVIFSMLSCGSSPMRYVVKKIAPMEHYFQRCQQGVAISLRLLEYRLNSEQTNKTYLTT